MSSKEFPFSDFAESISAYSKARAFWEKIVREVLSLRPEAGWRPIQHLMEVPDGASMILGEDTYSVMITTWSPKTMRGARITQFAPLVLKTGNTAWCESWVEKIEHNGFESLIEVLCINCVLTRQTAEIAKERLTKFLVANCSIEEITTN
jgi:hypothetical protein